MVKISQAILSSQHHQPPHLVEETPPESDASTRGSPDEIMWHQLVLSLMLSNPDRCMVSCAKSTEEALAKLQEQMQHQQTIQESYKASIQHSDATARTASVCDTI
ncbi:hypothetical protein Syun_001516 [Stephania yunnanensis]|uniref:Uncharacterized protein n=1 Tax=Stephania yunnanensis TaxID=152371 RepID=A0AAP0QAZ5_9MAGN